MQFSVQAKLSYISYLTFLYKTLQFLNIFTPFSNNWLFVLAVFALSSLQHKACLYLTIFKPNSLIINRYAKMQILIFYCSSSRYVNHIAITVVHTGSDALTNALILKCDASFFIAQCLEMSFWSNSEKPNSYLKGWEQEEKQRPSSETIHVCHMIVKISQTPVAFVMIYLDCRLVHNFESNGIVVWNLILDKSNPSWY